jgi:hypothetical protein
MLYKRERERNRIQILKRKKFHKIEIKWVINLYHYNKWIINTSIYFLFPLLCVYIRKKKKKKKKKNYHFSFFLNKWEVNSFIIIFIVIYQHSVICCNKLAL